MALVAEIKGRGISSIALPPLGAGLGGLAWEEVKPRIERALGDLPGVRVILFEPRGEPSPLRPRAWPARRRHWRASTALPAS